MSLATLLKEKALPSRFSDLFNPLDTWYNNGKALSNGEWPTASIPAVNITEDKKAYHMSLAAPGLKKEDFQVELDGNLLTVSSEKEESKEEKDEKYSRKEYNYSSFTRSFTLPDEVIKDSIDVSYENGILNIVLPKTEKAQESTAKKLKVK